MVDEIERMALAEVVETRSEELIEKLCGSGQVGRECLLCAGMAAHWHPPLRRHGRTGIAAPARVTAKA